MRYFMGIDIGTSESKGVLADENARVVASLAIAHGMETPKAGYAEHDAENVWWRELCMLSKGLLEKSGVSKKSVEALGVSAIAPCCLPVDYELKPLRKAILYGVDVRAAKEIAELEALLGKDEILSRCGAPLSSQSAAAKVLWVKRNEPEVYEKAERFITSSTYLVAKLTGRYVIDHYTAAAWAPLYDVNKLEWTDDKLGICDEYQLARCLWTHEIAGRVHARAARETGLLEGTPVLTGTADAAAEAFSAGVQEPGDMMLMYGSSIFIIHVTDALKPDRRLWTGPYLFPKTYAVTAGMNCAGTLTKWFKGVLAPDIEAAAENAGENPYAALARMAKDVPIGSNGLTVLPYFSGERTPINDPMAKGVIFGLSLLSTRADIYNACLEGVGCAIGQHFDIFREMGLQTRRVAAVGGGTKNEKWLQIVSDIANRAQEVPIVSIGAAYGDALLAAHATGLYKDRKDITARLGVLKTVYPREDAHAAYSKIADRYARLYQKTRELMREDSV